MSLLQSLTGSKKNLALNWTRERRLALISPGDPELTLSAQTELLNLNRTSLYYQPKGPSKETIVIRHKIDEIFTEFPYYGSRRITAALIDQGIGISRPTVQKHMREMGIEAIYPKLNLSKRNLQHKVYPYLLRGITASYPNHIWGIDITYIRLRHGWMYLVAILDWFSRYVVAWELDQTLEIEFVLTAVKRALAGAKPQIMNSDQGSHFTSPQYIDLLKEAGVSISMDGRGRAMDNIFTERLWRSVKYDEVYIKDYESPREARTGINNYFQTYNFRRLHQALGYKRPADVYFRNSQPELVR